MPTGAGPGADGSPGTLCQYRCLVERTRDVVATAATLATSLTGTLAGSHGTLADGSQPLWSGTGHLCGERHGAQSCQWDSGE